MKKLFAFVLAIALVSTLSASIGCGGKKTGTAAGTSPAPTTTEKK